MTVHDLKTDSDVFDDVQTGIKTFEVRPDDRAYGIGDELVLHEWDPKARTVDHNQVEHVGAYTGRSCRRQVRYMLRGPGYGVQDGYVVMGLAPAG